MSESYQSWKDRRDLEEAEQNPEDWDPAKLDQDWKEKLAAVTQKVHPWAQLKSQ